MTMSRCRQVFFSTAYILRTKKAPILRLGLFESGRRNRIRTNDLYHVKVGRPKHIL